MSKTDTELKLRDAATQMKLAIANDADEEVFRSCIGSFLAHARSVTMLLERESKHMGNLDWYKAQMAELGELPLFKFFNEKRVYSIHKGVVAPIRKSGSINSIERRIVVKEKNKSLLEMEINMDVDKLIASERDIVNVTTGGDLWGWFFDTPSKHMPDDNGNVLRLCEDYFLVLKQLVNDWKINLSQRR